MKRLSLIHALFGSNFNSRNSSHSHACTSCGTIFTHANNKKGCKDAHKCPKCGEMLRGGWPQLTKELLCDYVKRGIVKV